MVVFNSHVDVETHIFALFTITKGQLTQDNSSQYQVLLPAELQCQTGVILSRLTALETSPAVAAAAAALKIRGITGLRIAQEEKHCKSLNCI